MDPEKLSQHNEWLRNKMKEEGRFYMVKTSLRGQTYLRCTLTNPFTEVSHLQAMLDQLEKTAVLSAATS
jgi:L-2,4-diaminobutyrate decarboxylase